jgi:hypothetical protein
VFVRPSFLVIKGTGNPVKLPRLCSSVIQQTRRCAGDAALVGDGR